MKIKIIGVCIAVAGAMLGVLEIFTGSAVVGAGITCACCAAIFASGIVD
jgi:hypothetical protein